MNAGIVAQFAVATVLPAIVSIYLMTLRERAAKNLGHRQWQVLCGAVFGLVAIFGTEFGIATAGATMNVRDAAPVVAGLFFGAPAGVIAGLIGGVERWFAALWGKGMFTRAACALGTCAAGIYAALLRRHVFDNRKPSWPLAFVTGVVVEVLHLMLVFITRPDAPEQAFHVVRACAVPMVCCNAIAVALAALVLARMAGEWPHKRPEAPNISQVMQSRLLIAIVAGFLVSVMFTSAVQGGIARAETESVLSLALSDATSDINKASDDNLLVITRRVSYALPNVWSVTQEEIDALVEEFDVSEINVVDETGFIVHSNIEEYVGFDMSSGEQSAAFLVLLPSGGRTQLVQSYQPRTYDENEWRKYAGVSIGGGFVQVAYDADQFVDDLLVHVEDSVRNRHVGQNGYLVVYGPDGSLVGKQSGLFMPTEDTLALFSSSESRPENTVYTFDVLGEPHYVSYCFVEGYRMFALEPVAEAQLSAEASVLMMAFMEVIVFAVLFVAVYLLIKNEVVQSIWKVNGTLDQIAQGDLEAEVAVRNNAEFISLSHDINAMVASLRNAIAAEAARIDRELDYARIIQESALPSSFPPFPEVGAFDIYASMNAAREVGGDFYDFFLIDDHTLGFLVADVSGKGIPASLFMMAAKAELSNYMLSGMPLAEAVQTANWHLCQGNEADMFVTAWAATLDYETGELTYVNAGHNPPLLRRNGSWEWLRTRGGLFLGSFDTAKYRSATLVLNPGDELLLYTDGVSEAFSASEEQYGDARLEAFLAKHAALHPHPLVDALRADLARWAQGAEQSDDITMLALEYGVAPQATGSLTVPATLDQLEVVLDFIHGVLRDRSCPLTTQNQLDIVIEELFVNVCNYAYKGMEKQGTVTVDYVYNANPSAITVSITDRGVPFDLLAQADPETPKSADEARIGGLGILMVKRMTDDLSYVRDGDKNVVAFVKGW